MRNRDYRVAPEDFAILPWGTSRADAKSLSGIRECGFNLAGFVGAGNVEAVEKAGLKCIVIDPSIHAGDDTAEMTQEEILSRVSKVADQVATSPAVFGFYLRDEPAYTMYPCLARWAEAVRKMAPGKLAYINLFPNYVPAHALPNGNYDDYLTSFVEIVKPSFISYDHYAMMEDGSVRDGYFQNLESVRKVSLKYDLPFWNIVLGNAHFKYAEPSPATLRFQAFTTLAYGARGISYFTYFISTTGNYRLSPIDQFGNKTPTWDMMRNVNLQLHALAKTYITLKSVNVFHHPHVPRDCSGIDSSKFVKDITGEDLLVGEFTTPEGNPAIIVVNKSLTSSTPFAVTFKASGSTSMVNSYSGRITPWVGENNWLAPGQGMLLLLVPEAK